MNSIGIGLDFKRSSSHMLVPGTPQSYGAWYHGKISKPIELQTNDSKIYYMGEPGMYDIPDGYPYLSLASSVLLTEYNSSTNEYELVNYDEVVNIINKTVSIIVDLSYDNTLLSPSFGVKVRDMYSMSSDYDDLDIRVTNLSGSRFIITTKTGSSFGFLISSNYSYESVYMMFSVEFDLLWNFDDPSISTCCLFTNAYDIYTNSIMSSNVPTLDNMPYDGKHYLYDEEFLLRNCLRFNTVPQSDSVIQIRPTVAQNSNTVFIGYYYGTINEPDLNALISDSLSYDLPVVDAVKSPQYSSDRNLTFATCVWAVYTSSPQYKITPFNQRGIHIIKAY
jgi:hypothetical protein